MGMPAMPFAQAMPFGQGMAQMPMAGMPMFQMMLEQQIRMMAQQIAKSGKVT